MAYNLVSADREQLYLLPSSIRDWLAEDHLVWFILDVVGEMDLSGFYARHREDGWGRAAFDPAMMVALLLYCYCTGERSSRKIERRCREDVACRVISANHSPDHTTISRFRQGAAGELNDLFVEVLKLCAEAGLVKVGVVALDGTKVGANASLGANRTSGAIDREVDKILQEARDTDAHEDRLIGEGKRAEQLPGELADPTSRLARLAEAKARLEGEAAERQAAHQEHLDQRALTEADSGKRIRGRKPKAPDPQREQEAKANITDPDSRILHTPRGYLQGYNAQATVTDAQIVLAAEITQDHNDLHQLHPMLEKTKANLTAAGVQTPITTLVADAGYYSENNIIVGAEDTPELLIATRKHHKHARQLREQGPPRGRIPKSLTPKERMERKLRTKRGGERYGKRRQTVEPVFGQHEQRGGKTLCRRGVTACNSEWKLENTTHNLLKLWRSGRHAAKGGTRKLEKARQSLASWRNRLSASLEPGLPVL